MEMACENLRKVALLVASLESETAERLLEQLPADRADAIRRAVGDLDLDDVDAYERQAVMRDFLTADGRERLDGALLSAIPSGGAARPARRRPASRRADATAISSETAAGAEGRPIERASERLIAECLSDEMPQAIAVALAQLPTERASEVVGHLPAPLQTQVLERLVELDPATALDAPEIRDEFQYWLNEQIARSLHRAELAARLATILEATHSGTRQRILNNVSNSDARLAKELQHQLAAMSGDPDRSTSA
jgi:flagellar motor switch protein FliG